SAIPRRGKNQFHESRRQTGYRWPSCRPSQVAPAAATREKHYFSASEYHSRAQRDFTRRRCSGFVEGLLPSAGHFDGELVLRLRSAANFPRFFPGWTERMLVNCGGVDVEPNARRMGAPCDGLAQNPG